MGFILSKFLRSAREGATSMIWTGNKDLIPTINAIWAIYNLRSYSCS